MTCKLEMETWKIDNDLYVVTGEVEMEWDEDTCIPDVQIQYLDITVIDSQDNETVFDPETAKASVVNLLVAHVYKFAEDWAYENYGDKEDEDESWLAEQAWEAQNNR